MIRTGLQTKFIIITTVAIVLLMGLIGYTAVEREKSILYAEVERQGRLLGETLAIPIVNDLIYERLGLVEEGGLLDNYIIEIFSRQDAELLYIAILDETGKVISHNDITEYGKTMTDPVTGAALAADKTIIQPVSEKGQSALDFGIPLSIGKKRWGTLKFGISLAKVEHEVAATVRNIVLLTIVLLVLGFAVILLLSRRFIRPITQLANTMEKARGDYLDLKVEVKGHDEIAALGERFNGMIGRIRQANRELKKTHERLIQSEKLASIGILAAGVAHEINNPLGGLFNCLEMLRQNGTPGAREKYLELAREGLDRIETTVNKLLWMSRKGEAVPADVDVAAAADSVYSFLEYKLRKNGVSFVREVPDGVMVRCDVRDFQQLLLNLFINAVHAMKTGGTLTLRAERANGKVTIEVADTGEGIARENVGRVFDPFFTTKQPGEGTGLGLWLSYEIVRNYNGEISVESEEGKGSTFTLCFPAQAL